MNFGEVRRAQLVKSTLLPPRWWPWNLFRSFKVCSLLKKEWGAGSNWKLPHLLIPSKTATLVPKFAVEDLPLVRTATLVSEFAVKEDLPLARTLWWWWIFVIHEFYEYWLNRGNVNPTQHLPWWLRETTKRTPISFDQHRDLNSELSKYKYSVMNFDRRYAVCIQKLYHGPHFIVGRSWNKSLHLKLLQWCYWENSGSPTSACVVWRHYTITYMQ